MRECRGGGPPQERGGVQGIEVGGVGHERADRAALEETDAEQDEGALGHSLIEGGSKMQHGNKADGGKRGHQATQIVGDMSPGTNGRHRERGGQGRVNSNKMLLEALIAALSKRLGRGGMRIEFTSISSAQCRASGIRT